jgi:hypothetical protein
MFGQLLVNAVVILPCDFVAALLSVALCRPGFSTGGN